MADFAYTGTPSKLKDLLGKIKTVGVPANVTQTWLRGIKFTSSNDRSLITVLKFIDFVDTSGTPTPRWLAYRSIDGQKTLADAIVSAYHELYDMYPDAHAHSDDELQAFFASKSKAGIRAITNTVNTFKAVCELADFTGGCGSSLLLQEKSTGDASRQEGNGSTAPDTVARTTVTRTIQDLSSGVTVNINIQLTIPETTNTEIYDSLFASMRKHFWSDTE